MAGGGQRGLSFLGEDKAFTAAATASILLLLQLLLGCLNGFGSDAPDDPLAGYEHDCKQEYVDSKDGNPDTKVDTAILEMDDCRAVIAAMQAERRADQVDQIQEAQTP